MRTGTWPNGTVFVLEGRNSSSEGSINKGGRYQTDLGGVEAEVKDSRFESGWAYFNFGRGQALKDAAEPLAGDALARGQCVECHTKNGAVERTFGVDTVQITPAIAESDTLTPSARVVIGKRISTRAYLTFARALGTSNDQRDQILVLEYDQNDRIGWVLTQLGDNTYSLDFRVRHRF